MYGKIMIATDLSETSAAALRVGLELGRRLGAAITVLHVAEPPYPSRPWLVPFSEKEVEFLEGLARRERDAARRVLDDQIRQSSPDPREALDVEVIVKGGIAADEIIGTARELGSDLLVVGTHGRRGLRHVLLGSIAERVLRTAPCPVLTVRMTPT